MQVYNEEKKCYYEPSCYLRKPNPPECTPCYGERPPICACDKQPKIIASIIGYYCIHREPREPPKEEPDIFTLVTNWHKQKADILKAVADVSREPCKYWPAKPLYHPCRECRDYRLRLTTNGLYGRGWNNSYNHCELKKRLECQQKNCGCPCCCCDTPNDCDLYGVCNDRY